jgi:hypothetical protein
MIDHSSRQLISTYADMSTNRVDFRIIGDGDTAAAAEPPGATVISARTVSWFTGKEHERFPYKC